MSSFNFWISQGYAPSAAKKLSKSKNQAGLLSKHNAYRDEFNATQQQQRLQEQMVQRQQQLIREAMKPAPKAAQSLRSSSYQPKFKTRGSKAESNRAVSRGTSQFTNPLSMGNALGGSSINLG